MDYQPSLALLIFSFLLLGAAAGTYTALELLSYVHPDKKTAEYWWNSSYVKQLLDRPLNTSLFLWITRGGALVLVTGVSVYFASNFLFDKSSHAVSVAGTIVFTVLMVSTPIAAANYFAVKRAQSFVDLSKFIIYPLLLASKPIISGSAGVLERVSPSVVEALACRLIPLEQKINMFANENGTLEEDEQKLVSSIFDFGDTVVREVMVPRIDIIAVNVYTSKAEALDIINEAGHSRIPVYEETIDNIIGIVYTKDLLRKIVEDADFTLENVTRGVFFVPESKKIDELLSEFKKQKKHIAIAVDEYGGTAGLITMEDVLEELVGDIQDEFDSEEALIKRLDENSALCNAKVHLDELREMLGLAITVEDVDSLGGFLYDRIGQVPRVGDTVKKDGIVFEIKSIERQRIDKVLITGLQSISNRPGNGFSG
jgi:putative hemolysin